MLQFLVRKEIWFLMCPMQSDKSNYFMDISLSGTPGRETFSEIVYIQNTEKFTVY